MAFFWSVSRSDQRSTRFARRFSSRAFSFPASSHRCSSWAWSSAALPFTFQSEMGHARLAPGSAARTRGRDRTDTGRAFATAGGRQPARFLAVEACCRMRKTSAYTSESGRKAVRRRSRLCEEAGPLARVGRHASLLRLSEPPGTREASPSPAKIYVENVAILRLARDSGKDFGGDAQGLPTQAPISPCR